MTHWIRHDNGAVPYDSIVKARAAAAVMIENNPKKYMGKGGVMVYATQKGKTEGIVYYDERTGKFYYGTKDKKHGWVSYAMYKNGKLIR